MRAHTSSRSLGELCGLFGITRQAYYDRSWHEREASLQDAIVLQLVRELREKMPRLGTAKLYHLLQEPLSDHGIKMGRDALYTLLSEHGLKLRNKKRRVQTTLSRHRFRKYANLIKELEIVRPGQVWVSDITYITMSTGFSYLSLITDAYSRKIVGYCLCRDLSCSGPLTALAMAFEGWEQRKATLIHHSDRGIQYCSDVYANQLLSHGIAISMTEKGDPYENALAERVNGILKEEFGLNKCFASYEEAKEKVEESVSIYNELRPHSSLDFLTPDKAHLLAGPIPKRWQSVKPAQE